jgi:hypothetical protein
MQAVDDAAARLALSTIVETDLGQGPSPRLPEDPSHTLIDQGQHPNAASYAAACIACATSAAFGSGFDSTLRSRNRGDALRAPTVDRVRPDPAQDKPACRLRNVFHQFRARPSLGVTRTQLAHSLNKVVPSGHSHRAWFPVADPAGREHTQFGRTARIAAEADVAAQETVGNSGGVSFRASRSERIEAHPHRRSRAAHGLGPGYTPWRQPRVPMAPTVQVKRQRGQIASH